MRKKLTCLLLALCMILSFTACGKSNSDKSSDGTSSAKSTTSKLSPEVEKIVGRYLFYPYSWNPSKFAEFYSDGTGYTNYTKTSDEYEYNPIRWSYDADKDEYEVFYVRYVGLDSNKDHDNNGYIVIRTTLDFNTTTLVDGHFFLYCMTDSNVGDVVPRVNVFGVGTDGDWAKFGSPELTTPYGTVELDKNNIKTYEDYKEIWPEYEENFKDGKKYTVDSKAVDSLNEYLADPKAYRENYKK